MKSEVEKIILKGIETYSVKSIKIQDKTYNLFIFSKDEDLNLFEGFLFGEIDNKNELSHLISRYRPPVSGYVPRLSLLLYNNQLLIKDYRRNKFIRKTLQKINKPFISKLKKALLEPNENNFNKLFDRTDIIEEFYILYKKARDYLLKNIKGISEEERREEFVDNLMMQMLTLWYLQERGFFNNDTFYLVTKFKELKQKRLFNGFNNYYEFLVYFFDKICNHLASQYYEDRIVGKVVVVGPAIFLNGKHDSMAISIPDKCFYKEGMTEILINTQPKKVSDEVPLLNLFESKDWTEGNIDEFVLGAIYEKLITYMERKKLGAYYTPEEITSYICKNTIEPYLTDRVNEKFSERFERIDQIIERGDKQILFYLFEQLKEIKICDPAVGSAHFLESAINVLVNIYEKLWDKAKEIGLRKGLEILAADEKGSIKTINLLEISDDEQFKLYVKFFIILSKNIYGVDINPSALKVAKARLFLTLAKHFDIHKNYFIRFPNVHFNLREGNSLIGYAELKKEDKEKTQLVLDLFVKETEATYIAKRIKIVAELGAYLIETAKTLGINGNIVREIEQLDEILSKKEIKWNDFEFVLRTKEKLIRILIASLNSQYARPLNELLNRITELFNQKLDEKFAKEHNIDLAELKQIKTFHWVFEFPEVFLERGGFDVVVENPPWNAVKPVEKEFFSDFDPRLTKYGVDKKEAKRIIAELLKNHEIKKKWSVHKKKIEIEGNFYRNSGIYNYQSDIVGEKRVGGDLNYYKLFLERSYQFMDNKRFLGIIVPSGLHTDAGTKGLRILFFDNGNVFCVYNFENKKGIFDEIHKSFKFDLFIVKKHGKTKNFYGAFMLHDVEILNKMPQETLSLDWELMKKLSPDSLSINEFKSQKDVDIAYKMLQHSLLKENAWLGKAEFSTEFHMTNDSDLFNTEGKGLVLYEGKMIEQYNPYFEKNRYWIKEDVGREKLYGKNTDLKNYDYKDYRVGFRAVASSTNRRSMIASILPKNVFCGNSIIVLKLYDKEEKRLVTTDKLIYLCGVFNSFVFDYFLRLKITTNLNMFFIYQMPIPIPDDTSLKKIIRNVLLLTEDWKDFSELRRKYDITGKKLSKEDRLKLQSEIDKLVGKLYGLTKEEMKYVLNKFHHASPETEKELRTLEELILNDY